MKNLWEVWTSAFSPEMCDFVIEQAQKYQANDATIGFKDSNRDDKAYRTSSLRWLDVGDEQIISNWLLRYIHSSNRTNFGFDITKMNEIQYTEYFGQNNGHYDWHHDVWWENPSPYDRKLSIVVQLSDPNDYKGGEFEFFGCPSPSPEVWLPRGSVLIFPSFFHHQVHPVTEGHRISLVSWIEGPKWR